MKLRFLQNLWPYLEKIAPNFSLKGAHKNNGVLIELNSLKVENKMAPSYKITIILKFKVKEKRRIFKYILMQMRARCRFTTPIFAAWFHAKQQNA